MKVFFAIVVALTVSCSALASDWRSLKPIDAFDPTKIGIAAKFVRLTVPKTNANNPDNFPSLRTPNEDFEIQVTEVTQQQYLIVTNSFLSVFSFGEYCEGDLYGVAPGFSACLEHPLDQASYLNAGKFIETLNVIQDIYTYRLPTEVEWIYAATSGRMFPIDEEEFERTAWSYKNSKHSTHRVATKTANAFGLYDMFGNVREWIQNTNDDEQGIPIDRHIMTLGGSWLSEARLPMENLATFLRASVSRWEILSGFRLVRQLRQP